MKAVILAGGLGTRLSEETYLRPKLKIDEALILTYDWFSKSLIENDMREFSSQQIIDYDINA